jgi:LuxR family transcriptional regulator, maltose regulon positive regulatory protein
VVRPRLHRLIDEGVGGPLTLLSALPGYGKTVALKSWVSVQRPGPWLARLSLESQDSDTTRFWAHILASIGRALPPRYRSPIRALAPPRSGRVERFLARLIEVVGDLPRPLLLVVDDAQEIAHAEASAGLERLVWLAPEQVRVIISTSADPRMSLPRLRANGDVVEIRARDLAFTAREAAELMSGQGVRLAPEQVPLLTHRTEGWAAALRLAAVSLRDRSDPDEFCREPHEPDRP